MQFKEKQKKTNQRRKVDGFNIGVEPAGYHAAIMHSNQFSFVQIILHTRISCLFLDQYTKKIKVSSFHVH